METDPILSDDVYILRQEIARLRAFIDCDFTIRELYRVQNDHLKSIIASLITNGYGKS